MITAVDSNVLIDVLSPDPARVRGSWEALGASCRREPLVACDVVYSEVAGLFNTSDEARRVLAELGVRYEPTSERAALQPPGSCASTTGGAATASAWRRTFWWGRTLWRWLTACSPETAGCEQLSARLASIGQGAVGRSMRLPVRTRTALAPGRPI